MPSDERIRGLSQEALRLCISKYAIASIETAIRTAVAEAVTAERKICAEIGRNECRAAHVAAIGQDVAAAILARGKEQ